MKQFRIKTKIFTYHNKIDPAITIILTNDKKPKVKHIKNAHF